MRTDLREFTFVVRLRRQSGGIDPQWRGSVQEVSSGDRRFITTTREVAEFIAAYLRGGQRADP